MNKIFLKTDDNIKIAINHYFNDKDSVVIICPGWFMSKDSKHFLKIAEDLAKDFDIIAMDFRGHGKSDGFYTFTAKEGLDLAAVVNYSKNSCHYNNIYLLGFSLGGAMVLIGAANNEDIKKVIAVSAPTEFMKIENHMYSPDAWIPTLFQKFEPLRWLTIRPGFPFYKKEKPIDIVHKINAPTLFIAGEKDPTVFPWHTENLYKAAKCKKDYKLFKNARHAEDLYTDFPDEFIKVCIKWFRQDEL